MKTKLLFITLTFALCIMTMSIQAQQEKPLPRQFDKSQMHGKVLVTTPEPVVQPPLTVAVLNFESSDEKLSAKAAEATALLSAHLSGSTELWMVERVEIDKLLSEQTLNLSGLSNPDTATNTAKLLGAKAMITGRLIKNRETAILVAKIMSTETSRVFGETSTATNAEDISKAAEELSNKIIVCLNKQSAAFRTSVVTEEDRMAALKKAVDGKKLPSVSVKIAERDLQQTSIDPAVETEFKKVLKELGFPLLEGSDKEPATVIITGEAFSQTGSRRGQLISARARAEVQAVNRANGEVLAVDRETATAVDIAESVAGKSALQKAALILLDRMVPKLVTE